MLLTINNLDITLGGLQILQDVSLHVDEGELVVVVGANGTGKSTLLRSISGMNPIAGGEILFCGEKITGLPSSLIARKGLCMVPEGRQLFPELSARDNLLIGAYPYRKDKARVQKNLDFAYQMFPAIRKYEDRMANTFSGGEQQMISIARGLMSEPKLMMIDEMSLGLAPMIIADLFKVIKRLNAQGISILLVEQNARQALRIADRAYVMENGRMVMEGSGKELLENEHVKVAYLGM
ncbi:ABC transporter ATP-binding protein [Anaerotruncus massiliensis (ex Liu et al. 2021)]|uniref:ABC transporter ATP-binding protein n=2 Tax=Anaerotruncus TaxID=244127 RepID=A0A498CJP4_9FIRM|nr:MULTISPECIES: ABC transporter ATP-binding protein [Anaerotruncus]MBC3939875.1 ABC transporter ATP-binding protein [Anaerotruncus massiliensis (ex Togo et al. 2019)]RLL07654.1 ABC transporter ATP-binding protein [Anaerotruncus massiliensis (ex Liu et al. 2021)]